MVLVPGETAHPSQKCCSVRSDMPILRPGPIRLQAALRLLKPGCVMEAVNNLGGKAAMGFEVLFQTAAALEL